MTELIEQTSKILRDLGEKLEKTYSPDQNFYQHIDHGWNAVPLNTDILSARAHRLANSIEAIKGYNFEDWEISSIAKLHDNAKWYIASSLPNFASDYRNCVINCDILLNSFESFFNEYSGWEELSDRDILPRSLSNKLKLLLRKIDELSPEVDKVSDITESIFKANDVINSLPLDVDEISQFRNKAESYVISASKSEERLDNIIKQCELSLSKINESESKSSEILDKISKTSSAFTSMGLSKSFSDKASSLTKSTWIWVVLLISTLVTSTVVGYERLIDFNRLMQSPTATSDKLYIHAALTFLSVGAPIWFAWLATRQISQRFRLAEDYGFKASVAKAYEGYRLEASRIDAELERRLFSSALERLEEAPLRLIEKSDYDSPYEALLNSKGFLEALKLKPELKVKFLDILGVPTASLALEAKKAPQTSPDQENAGT